MACGDGPSACTRRSSGRPHPAVPGPPGRCAGRTPAVLATEDGRFADHAGVDWRNTVRTAAGAAAAALAASLAV